MTKQTLNPTEVKAKIFFISSSIPNDKEPCCETNPDLYNLWAEIKHRDPLNPSYVWTEADIIQSIDMWLSDQETKNAPRNIG